MHRVLLTPIFKFPIWKSWIRFSSRSPRPMESKAVFTCWKRIVPSLVSWTPREFRLKSLMPRLSSSLLMALLMAGWLM